MKSQFGGITLQRRRLLHRHQEPAGHRSTPAPARRASCSTRPRRTRWASSSSSAPQPIAGPRSFARRAASLEAEFDSTVLNGQRHGARRHPRRQPPALGAEIPDGGERQLCLPGQRQRRRGLLSRASFQHVGSRYTQPSDQENNPRTFVHGLPFGGAPAGAATTVDLKLPDYQLVNLSAGVEHGTAAST